MLFRSQEAIPLNMPEPKGNSVNITVFVDADHADNSRTLGPGSGLVSMSARSLCIGTFVMRMIPAANASRTLWYAIALLLFECRLRPSSIHYHTHIVAEYTGWAINWYAKHM